MIQEALRFRYLYTTVAFLLILVFSPVKHANGQIGDLGEIFEGGQDDAQILIQEYLKPFGSGFGAGINSGWVDRANTHGVLGFHLKVNITAAMVPDSDQSFNVNDVGLQELQVLEGDPVTPTFSGSSNSGPMMGFTREVTGTGETVEVDAFQMPEGVGFSYIPTPMVQAGVGLPKNTDFMLRVIPPISYQDYGEVHLYGVGAKHELNQWVPGGMLWPVTLSVMAGYTAFGSSVGLDATPTGQYEDPDNIDTPATWEDQEITLNTNAFTMNVLVGKSLPILSVYGGLGFETSTTSVTVDGNYPYLEPSVEPDGSVVRELNALADPVDTSFDGSNSLRALAGLRVSLPLITFNIDYTLADYSMVTAGFGISFR